MVQIIFDCNIFCKIQASVRLGRGWAELESSGPGPWSVLRSEVSKRRDQNIFYYWNTSTLNFSWEKISNCYFTTPTIINYYFTFPHLFCVVTCHMILDIAMALPEPTIVVNHWNIVILFIQQTFNTYHQRNSKLSWSSFTFCNF